MFWRRVMESCRLLYPRNFLFYRSAKILDKNVMENGYSHLQKHWQTQIPLPLPPKNNAEVRMDHF